MWREKERSSIWTVQAGSLRSLVGIKRIYRIPNARVLLCGVEVVIDEMCSPEVEM